MILPAVTGKFLPLRMSPKIALVHVAGFCLFSNPIPFVNISLKNNPYG